VSWRATIACNRLALSAVGEADEIFGGDSPPVTVCVVTTLNSCGLTPTDGGPKTQGPLGPTVGSPTTSQDIAQIGAPVPEASTWLLMIVGFGGAGALLRARRHGEPRGTPA